MKQISIKKGFLLVLLAFAVSAITPLLVPFAVGEDGNLNALGYTAGALFWAGLIIGIAGYILIKRQIKSRNGEEKADTAQKKGLPSALRFFSNPPARIMDAVLIIGAAGTAYCAVHITANQIIAALFLWMLLAGIYAHFLLNGNVYRHIWNHKTKQKGKEIIEGKE